MLICKEMLPRGKDPCGPLWTVSHRKHMWPCLRQPGKDDGKLPGSITAHCLWSTAPAPSKAEKQLGRNLSHSTGRSLNQPTGLQSPEEPPGKEGQWPSVFSPSCPQTQVGLPELQTRLDKHGKQVTLSILQMRTECQR